MYTKHMCKYTHKHMYHLITGRRLLDIRSTYKQMLLQQTCSHIVSTGVTAKTLAGKKISAYQCNRISAKERMLYYSLYLCACQ